MFRALKCAIAHLTMVSYGHLVNPKIIYTFHKIWFLDKKMREYTNKLYEIEADFFSFHLIPCLRKSGHGKSENFSFKNLLYFASKSCWVTFPVSIESNSHVLCTASRLAVRTRLHVNNRPDERTWRSEHLNLNVIETVCSTVGTVQLASKCTRIMLRLHVRALLWRNR